MQRRRLYFYGLCIWVRALALPALVVFLMTKTPHGAAVVCLASLATAAWLTYKSSCAPCDDAVWWSQSVHAVFAAGTGALALVVPKLGSNALAATLCTAALVGDVLYGVVAAAHRADWQFPQHDVVDPDGTWTI